MKPDSVRISNIVKLDSLNVTLHLETIADMTSTLF